MSISLSTDLSNYGTETIKHKVPSSSSHRIKNSKTYLLEQRIISSLPKSTSCNFNVKIYLSSFALSLLFTFWLLYALSSIVFNYSLLSFTLFSFSSTTCFLVLLLWFIIFSNSVPISCSSFLLRHYVCFCGEGAFLTLFTRIEVTGV